ncbi:LysM peptidoglycan-binding domain-containing M23 family metallopeptidase [Phreatobacter aquaticus]|nr:LysM peptidoglycan-binding domain-containing M23 family metallopeptidase [Phreatobacter aquaticus]
MARFDENPFRSGNVAQSPRQEVVASVPTARVDSAPLSPANDIAAPVRRQGAVESSPFGSNSADPGLTTGTVTQRSTFGSSNPQTPAVRQMAAARATGAQPVAGSSNGWSAAGGTTIQASSGDTVDSLSRRYGVPAPAIAQANGLSAGQGLSPGQSVVIPTYSIGSTQQRAPVAAAPAPVQAAAPAAPVRQVRTIELPRAPAPVATARNEAATAPVPAARAGWQVGAQPRAAAPSQPVAQAQPVAPTRQATRPVSHTVAMGENLASIATRYGTTPAEIARTNNIPSGRPVRIGQSLRLPGAGQVAQAQPAPDRREQAQRTVAQVQATPAGQRADQRATAAIPPAQPAAREAAPALAAAQTQPAPAPAQAAQPAPAQAAAAPAAAPAAASSEPQFRWPVRGRVITSFRAGTNDGIKMAVPEGTPIKAAEDGVVAYAGNELRGYGNLVLVRHSNGFVTAYAHNSNISVRRGEQVRRGQTIAAAGQTGNVSSPQLHFEIRRGATPVDPMTYLGSN